MKLILISFILVSLSIAQTRPTGGSGPRTKDASKDEIFFNSLVSSIETTIEMNYDDCQIGMIRPETFSLIEIYQLLNAMHALNSISDFKTYDKHSLNECHPTTMKLSPQMICLTKGTELSLRLLSSYRGGTYILQKRFSMEPNAVKEMVDFFNLLNISKQDQKIYKK